MPSSRTPVNYVNPVVAVYATLNLNANEVIGPKTNSKTTGIFHPDMSQTSPDRGKTEKATRANQRSTWLPTKLGTNIELKNSEYIPSGILTPPTIGMYFQGEEGQYIKNKYASEISPDYPTITTPEDMQYLSISETTQD